MAEHEIHLDAVMQAIARRHRGGATDDLIAAMHEILWSVAPDLKGEEFFAVVWSVVPSAFVIGSSEHRRHRQEVAAALYPDVTPQVAAGRFRSVLRRPAVRSTIEALRAEEMLHVVGERVKVREQLWAIAMSAPPGGSEPKDEIAHTKARMAALAQLRAMDGLDERPTAAPASAGTLVDVRKKVLDRLSRLRQPTS